MVDPDSRLPVTPRQLMIGCAVLAFLCMLTNLEILKSPLDWANAASVVFGFLVMLTASGTGCWIALKTLRETEDGSTDRKLAIAGLIGNLLPVMIATLVWMSASHLADQPRRPMLRADVRSKKDEKPRRRGPEPVLAAGNLISASRFGQEIVKLEQALYQEGPSTLAAVGRVYRQSEQLASALRGMRRMSEFHPDGIDPAALPYLEKAETAVTEFRNEVTTALIFWTDRSSLANLRSRWEPLRQRYFTHQPWMKTGSYELDLAQSERKPDVDSDLTQELAMLDELVADLEMRTEFDEQWASYVSDVLRSTRVWAHRRDVAESMSNRVAKGWKQSVNLGPNGPRKLMDVYSRMRSVCESFFYYMPTPHWMTEKHQTRLAASSRQRLEGAWEDILALQYPD